MPKGKNVVRKTFEALLVLTLVVLAGVAVYSLFGDVAVNADKVERTEAGQQG